MKKILITICARGGSKGIPRKNIRDLNEIPLIAYSIRHAYQFKTWFEESGGAVDIELSTDDDEIVEIAAQFSLNTNYKRPKVLANDTAGKVDAIKDVLYYVEGQHNENYDYVLDLDVSAPMRTLDDLIGGFDLFEQCTEALNLFSVSKAHKNPYFNMVEQNAEGFYVLSKQSQQILSRQEAPQVFEMNASFYFYRRSFFEQEQFSFFKKSLIFEMKHMCFDLDEWVDFEFLEFLVKYDKLPFKL